MVRNINVQSRSVPILLIAILAIFIVIQPCLGIKVVGSKLLTDVSPGDTITHKMTVSIGSDEAAIDVEAEVMGFGQKLDQRYDPLDPVDDTGNYSARTFITLDKNSLHLTSGSSADFIATVKIPSNVGPGGRYAMIYIHSVAPSGGGTTFATAVAVPVLLTIKTPGLINAGKITGVDIGKITSGQPAIITTTMMNTGNHHYYHARNELTIKDASGSVLDIIIGEPTAFAIIPGSTVQFKTPLDSPLDVGMYSVISKMILETNVTMDTMTTEFEVKEAYKPPFAEASINVVPNQQNILASSDGRIAITFPQGAVFDTTKVTLKPVSLEELLDPPSGVYTGSLGFSVEGITGLLSKDATISVKYTPADLALANGDPSKLVLARWDRTANDWVFIRTSVDKNAETLTVSTNRLSTWAVMAAEGPITYETPVAGTTTSQTPGFGAGIACGTLALLFIAERLRRRRNAR
jgi:hypothetical protein